MDIRRLAFIIASMLTLLSGAASSRAADLALPHVRSTDRDLSRWLIAAEQRSATLQRLFERLDQSNVIVYIEHAVLGSTLRGRLRFAGTNGAWRYVRVDIDCRQNLVLQVAILGHELQHAVEIAGAMSAVDEPSLQRLYREIGFALDSGGSKFESDLAIETGVQVQREWLSTAVSWQGVNY